MNFEQFLSDHLEIGVGAAFGSQTALLFGATRELLAIVLRTVANILDPLPA